MKSYKIKFWNCLLILLLSGCASLGPNFEMAQVPSKDKSLVYVYRPNSFAGSMQSPDLKIDDKKMGTSFNGSFFTLEISPGMHKASLVNFAGEEIADLEAKLIAGKTYFLRLDIGAQALNESVDLNGRATGQRCLRKVVHFASVPSSNLEILHSMDTNVQSTTCWPGFMFVNETLALKELPQTKINK
jgi:Protein of unknown function (DUF2846)